MFKNFVKSKIILLPRQFRIFWGKCFIYMLGKFGTKEVSEDITLYNELRKWLDHRKSKSIPVVIKEESSTVIEPTEDFAKRPIKINTGRFLNPESDLYERYKRRPNRKL